MRFVCDLPALNLLARARGTNAPRPDGTGRPSAWSRSRAPCVPRWCSFPSPGDLRFAGGERGADVVGDIVGKRRVGVDRPAAEIERVDVVREGRETRFWKRDLAPSQPPMASNSLASSSIGARPAASASSSQTLMPSSNTASISPRASGARRRTSDGPPQVTRRPPQDSTSLRAKPCSANACSISTNVEWVGSSRTETRSGQRLALMSASRRSVHGWTITRNGPARIDRDDADGQRHRNRPTPR